MYLLIFPVTNGSSRTIDSPQCPMKSKSWLVPARQRVCVCLCVWVRFYWPCPLRVFVSAACQTCDTAVLPRLPISLITSWRAASVCSLLPITACRESNTETRNKTPDSGAQSGPDCVGQIYILLAEEHLGYNKVKLYCLYKWRGRAFPKLFVRPKRKTENTTNKEEFEEFDLFTCIIFANTQMELLLQRVGKFHYILKADLK